MLENGLYIFHYLFGAAVDSGDDKEDGLRSKPPGFVDCRTNESSGDSRVHRLPASIVWTSEGCVRATAVGSKRKQ
jgi:hypothetical protein